MMREQIESAAATRAEQVSDHGWWREVDVVAFAIEQVNKALDEAQAAIGSARAQEAIELCKVK